MRIADIPQLEKLTVPEKNLLLEDIWDNISSKESAILYPRGILQNWTEGLQDTRPAQEHFYLLMH